MKKIRIASLPPGVSENTIRDSLTKHGEVKNIREGLWTSVYRYKVYNGIRIVDMNLKQHLPSHMSLLAIMHSSHTMGSPLPVTNAMKRDTYNKTVHAGNV